MSSPSIADSFTFLPVKYRRHALPTLIGVLVVIVATIAINSYLTSSRQASITAINEILWQLDQAVAAQDVASAEEQYAQVQATGNQVQLVLASMKMGYLYFTAEQYADASSMYQTILENTENKAMRDTARIRLAKVLQTERKYQEALDTFLELESTSGVFVLLAESITGDINLTQGKFADATFAYNKALEQATLINNDAYAEVLKNKLAAVTSLRLQTGDVADLLPQPVEQ